MMGRPKLLVVGGDGSIGTVIRRLTPGLSIDAVYTSRRACNMAGNDIYFDLGVSSVNQLLGRGITHALLLAGISSIHSCERDPIHSYAKNVTSSGKLISKLSEHGIRVTMVSTNQVSGQDQCHPQVQDKRNPCCECGCQKAELEDIVLDLGGTGVRCTKVIASKQTILSEWVESLRVDHPIHAYTNVRIAPLCVKPVARSLVAIAVSEADSQIHHMSPATDGTYWQAAVLIADLLERSRDLVIPSWAHEDPSEGVIARNCAALGVPTVRGLERFGTFSKNIVNLSTKNSLEFRRPSRDADSHIGRSGSEP